MKILLHPTSRTARTMKETPAKYIDSSTLSCLAAMKTSEKSSHSPCWQCWLRKKHPHTKSGMFQSHFYSLRYFSILGWVVWGMKIQHNDLWGLQPTHSPCGPEKAMCFLHWQQLVSTTDTSATNPSTKWIGQRLKLQKPGMWCVSMGTRARPYFSKKTQHSCVFPHQHHPAQCLHNSQEARVS